MFRSPAPLLSLAATILCAMPAQSYEAYKVTSIKARDHLVIREEPAEGGKVADWKEVGRIPAGSDNVLGTGRSKQIGKQRWLEVTFGSLTGWVNLTFLEATDPIDLKGATFSCAGTEPFWGVDLGPGSGAYSDPEFKTTLTTESIDPATARFFPLFYRLKGANGRTYRATVSHQQWCSDGMSDHEYAFQVLLTDDEVFQQGCCTISR